MTHNKLYVNALLYLVKKISGNASAKLGGWC